MMSLNDMPGGLRHVGVEAPLVLGGAEGDLGVLNRDLPLLLVLGLGVGLDEAVEVLDDVEEPLLHLLRGEAELLDQAVDLVDVEDGADPLLEGLPGDSVGLGHDALHCVDDYDCAVHGPEGPGDLSREVDVSRACR